MPSLKDIRTTYLDYFAGRGHTVAPSAPLVPQNDPTLLFVNAGMVPFKNIFTGAETRPYPRAATSQKCVRAGGKHNDLDNVGYTARHHTFFEMLGNFSFGDYFKPEAIEYAWTLVHQEFGLPKEKLLVTVYADDDEAFGLWRKIAGLSEDRIIRIGTTDNFWSMGDTGPCGPCSEIFYDHGADIPGGPPGSPEEDGDRFIEIWNLVFMQYEQITPDERVSLPKPSIDTGMGLERIAAVLQGVHNNYDVDLFRALIAASSALTGAPAEGDALPSHRVIADHLRASAFLVADGVTPSNEGRGYVLRRIMRRAMRHAHLLGAAEPLMWRLAPALIDQMGEAYPELVRAEALLTETLRQEEERFRRTLGRGLTILDEATSSLQPGDMLEGEVAFKLYDTYGFPLDLTQDALRARGLNVNLDGYETAMARQRAQARENWQGSGDKAGGAVWFSQRDKFGPTDFVGYDAERAQGRVLAIFQEGQPRNDAAAGETVDVLFDVTPFYAESGGQAADAGTVSWDGGAAQVLNVAKQASDLHVHRLKLDDGRLALESKVELKIDADRRQRTRANHSAAHLVHAALKRVLGDHVSQKGQMVDGDRMRFDFSHGAPMSADELTRVEDEVNAVIRQNAITMTEVMTPDEAISAGAVAQFGEKYGDTVRVLALGNALESTGAYSVELCGGTHVGRTGDIALFRIVSEQGVAAGIRRIEALTGEAARRFMIDQINVARTLAEQFKVPIADLPTRVEQLIQDRKRLEKDLDDTKRKLALGGGGAVAAPETINGVILIARILPGIDGKGLRPVVEDLRKTIADGVIAVVGVTDEGKAAIAVANTAPGSIAVSAADLVKVAVIAMGGQGGGGKPEFAQGGAPDGASAEAGLQAVRDALAGLYA